MVFLSRSIIGQGILRIKQSYFKRPPRPCLEFITFFHFDKRWAVYREYIQEEILTHTQYAFLIGLLIFLTVPIFSSSMHFVEHMILNFTGLNNIWQTASETFNYSVLQPVVKLYYSQILLNVFSDNRAGLEFLILAFEILM